VDTFDFGRIERVWEQPQSWQEPIFEITRRELGSWNKFLSQAPNAVLVRMRPVATPFGSNRSSKEFIPKNALA
jgi:hypothetical protein